MAAISSSSGMAATAANYVYRWWWPSATIGPPETIKIYLCDGSVNPWNRDLYGCVGFFANQANATNTEFKLTTSKWQFLNKDILGHIEMILRKVVSAQEKVRSLTEASFFAVALAAHQLIIPSLKDACRQHMVEILLMAPNAAAIRARLGMSTIPDWTDSDIKSVEADDAWHIHWPNVPPLSELPGAPHFPLIGTAVPLPPMDYDGGHNGDGIEGVVRFEHPDADIDALPVQEAKSPAIGASFLQPDSDHDHVIRHDLPTERITLPSPALPISAPLPLPGPLPSVSSPLSKEELTHSSDSLDSSDDGVDAHSPLSFSVNLAATRKPIIPSPTSSAHISGGDGSGGVVSGGHGHGIGSGGVAATPATPGGTPIVMPVIPRTFGISRQRAAFFSADRKLTVPCAEESGRRPVVYRHGPFSSVNLVFLCNNEATRMYLDRAHRVYHSYSFFIELLWIERHWRTSDVKANTLRSGCAYLTQPRRPKWTRWLLQLIQPDF